MADKKLNLAVNDYSLVQQNVKDLGDGTYAPVVSAQVVSGAGTFVQGTIAIGQTLSPFIDLGNQRLGRIGCPASVDGNTTLSFETSHDGVTSRPLFDQYGTEYTVTIAANRSVVPDLTMFAAARYIKVRFGKSAAAGTVATVARTFDLSTLA